MPNQTLVQPGDNADLTRERQKGSFDVKKMAAFIYGGEDVVKRREEIRAYVASQPGLQDPIPPEFMTRLERVENNARKSVLFTDNAEEVIDASDFFGEGHFFQQLCMGRDFHSLTLHYAMFFPTLQGQADDEQLDEWLAPTVARAIVGTYAQTELGHGTNLSKLETTATYDPKTQEFVVHSPTITAAKWWPGNLGKSSNVAIVVANLITKGENKGPHTFFVQLRDYETHKSLKGVRLGDIGPKFGANGGDNGYLLFNQVRIPRRHMLMRNAKVLPDGTYVPPSHAKLAFGTMIFVRSIMIKDQASSLAAAATIAIRYSAIRRQGELKPGAGEVQILDYQTQQLRLFPQLARAYAFTFAAYEIRDFYKRLTEGLASGDTSLLPEIHALSSGLKSVVSWETAQGIEQCRLACGGHGYSAASALPEIYAFTVGGCTYEGENIVMLLQVAKSLVKAAEAVQAGRAGELAAIQAYIGKKGDARSRFTSAARVTDADLQHDFEHIARAQILRVYALLQERQKKLAAEDAWNATAVELCKAARLHVKLYLLTNMQRKVASCQDASLRLPLTRLARLYAFDMLASVAGELARGGFQSDAQQFEVREAIYSTLAELRPDAVALVDSWDQCDRELHSVLGRRDGNVYPALLEWVQTSPLNKQDVLSTYDKFLGPMMRDGRSKL